MDGLQASLDDSGGWLSLGHSPKPCRHCTLSANVHTCTITKYFQNSDDNSGEWTDQHSYVWQGFPTLCSQKRLVICQGSSFCFWF